MLAARGDAVTRRLPRAVRPRARLTALAAVLPAVLLAALTAGCSGAPAGRSGPAPQPVTLASIAQALTVHEATLPAVLDQPTTVDPANALGARAVLGRLGALGAIPAGRLAWADAQRAAMH